jgi:hypothetical protein
MMSRQLPDENNENGSGDGMEVIESDFPATDITAEKNLWQILKISFVLPKRLFNIYSTSAFLIIILCYAFWGGDSSSEIREELLLWAERGFSFSVGILGFLVAGVAIFTAANDVSLFTNLARIKHKKSKVSYLKYNFVALMYVFIVYLLLAFACFIVQVIDDMNPFWDSLIILLFIPFPNLRFDVNLIASFMNRLGYVIISTFFFYCLLLLKTFIFDIYALVMVSIRWSFQKEEDRKKNQK